ncbi:MAG: hypothetical protein IJA75_04060 [Oscillospiraceae bacterium]|nr:hypothetical protein [Oscillospiraceae bacterium]
MSLEQKLERSEELLEVNERNKEQVERSKQRLSRAQAQVHAGAARVQSCQAQLQQAVAARNAAVQNASRDEDSSPPDTSSYDAAISRAQSELSAANRELQEARRERLRAESELSHANAELKDSAENLKKEAGQLQDVARKYGLELSKTQALLSSPEGRLASPLFERLGAGRDRVNDLRRRIAASLGITLAMEGVPAAEGYRGGIRPGGGGGSPGGDGTATVSGGEPVYQSPYVKTTYTAPITYRNPRTGQMETRTAKRTVYQNRNMDPNMVVPAGTVRPNTSVIREDITNLELMRQGKAPFVPVQNPDGSVSYVPLELHHLSSEETQHGSEYFRGEAIDGSMVEIPTTSHKKYYSQIHISTDTSFRNTREKVGDERVRLKTADGAKYEEFRGDYWRYRASQCEAGR